MSSRFGLHRGGAVALLVVGSGMALVLVLGLAMAGLVGGMGILFPAGQGCQPGKGGTAATVAQPAASAAGHASVPADYLRLYQQVGRADGVPWAVLAGIGEVETDHGRSTLPGVHSAANAFGAAGPMQIGIGGAAGNTWGGAPVHPAGERVAGVAIDANGDGTASVYDSADAIAGAAKYLLEHGVQTDVPGAIFAYNHLTSYVQDVLHWAATYAQGGFVVAAATGLASGVLGAAGCLASMALTTSGGPGSAVIPNQAVAMVIAFARAQLGKPYVFGATGPDAFDCSGLMMMAYRAAGIDIPRTSEQQFVWGPRVASGQQEPGDLVFFAGADGTLASPGHVGLVIGNGMMIEAYATGFPLRVSSYGTPSSPPGDQTVAGFSRPWAHPGLVIAGSH